MDQYLKQREINGYFKFIPGNVYFCIHKYLHRWMINFTLPHSFSISHPSLSLPLSLSLSESFSLLICLCLSLSLFLTPHSFSPYIRGAEAKVDQINSILEKAMTERSLTCFAVFACITRITFALVWAFSFVFYSDTCSMFPTINTFT